METSNPASAFPRLIPVLDILSGQVVRAVGGRRSEYRPVRSVLTDSTAPGEVAKALVAATGATWLYVADLDAIMHGRPDVAGVRAVAAAGVPVMCDGGFRTAADATAYAGCRVTFVVGTETGTPATLTALGPSRCLLSIDLFDGQLIGDRAAWGASEVIELVHRAVTMGVGTVILLDLARVGAGAGPGTERLVADCTRSFPHVDVIAGGGVRTWDDVKRLGDAGADAVLVASALHDGTLTFPQPAR